MKINQTQYIKVKGEPTIVWMPIRNYVDAKIRQFRWMYENNLIDFEIRPNEVWTALSDFNSGVNLSRFVVNNIANDLAN